MLGIPVRIAISVLAGLGALALPAGAQIAPSEAEIGGYGGLLAAAASGDAKTLGALLDQGASIEQRDGHGRTALQIAVYRRKPEAATLLLARGADANAFDVQRYDIVTIAAVADDQAMLDLALRSGGKAANITSPYEGTALIAAAHLGHVAVVKRLIAAGAPLDHVNNLGWTALIEAIVLGDGGQRHTEVLGLLVAAGANVNLPDRNGSTPLTLAIARGYGPMAEILRQAGAK